MTRLLAAGVGHQVSGRTTLPATDLGIEPGEALLVTGRNGAGKSTLLALCVGLLHPNTGSVTLDGRPARDPAARVGVAALLPGAAPPRRTGRQLARALNVQPDWAELHLAGEEDRALGRLSGGERQRVRLALALSATRLLVLDEPLNTLDAPSMDAVITAVGVRRRRGCTVLIATHHPERWAPLGAAMLALGVT